jgi:hypothetical protein
MQSDFPASALFGHIKNKISPGDAPISAIAEKFLLKGV